MSRRQPEIDIVIPTVGRPSLGRLLARLPEQLPSGAHIIVVDDRKNPDAPLVEALDTGARATTLRLLPSGGGGPAAARNTGWQASAADWIVFLDDDVLPIQGWGKALVADLSGAPRLAGSQGNVMVPAPQRRRPTDFERSVLGLARAAWATADMAYRRTALERVGGFDEAFPRAFREDADIALRALNAGYELARGRRCVLHPIPSPRRWDSLRRQAGNRDDARMLVKHGSGWQERAGVHRGRRRRHLAVTGSAALALAAVATGHGRLAAAGAAGWLLGSAEFAVSRISQGPFDSHEIAEITVTSLAIPPLATYHWTRGLVAALTARRPAAVLFDRDGTLIEDVPFNGDPKLVRPRPGARRALDRLRQAGIPMAVVSNQSGVGRGLISRSSAERVSSRAEELLGPIDHWVYCWHAPDEGCGCRKPEPGLVFEAAARLGVRPRDCVVIGDIGTDVMAARAAGAASVLVPDGKTRPEEVRAAPRVAPSLEAAVELVLGVRR